MPICLPLASCIWCLVVCLLLFVCLPAGSVATELERTQHLSCQSVFPSVCLFVTIVMDSVLLPVGYVTCETDHQHWRGDPTAKGLSNCVSVCICLSQSMSDANFSLHSLTRVSCYGETVRKEKSRGSLQPICCSICLMCEFLIRLLCEWYDVGRTSLSQFNVWIPWFSCWASGHGTMWDGPVCLMCEFLDSAAGRVVRCGTDQSV